MVEGSGVKVEMPDEAESSVVLRVLLVEDDPFQQMALSGIIARVEAENAQLTVQRLPLRLIGPVVDPDDLVAHIGLDLLEVLQDGAQRRVEQVEPLEGEHAHAQLRRELQLSPD